MSEYDTNVDVDGDGNWDDVDFTENSDGSVTITADMNNDGRIDFVAQDDDRDGLVDHATYDENFDGTPDTTWTDVDGDGYLDTSRDLPQGNAPTADGEAPSGGDAPSGGTGGDQGAAPAEPRADGGGDPDLPGLPESFPIGYANN